LIPSTEPSELAVRISAADSPMVLPRTALAGHTYSLNNWADKPHSWGIPIASTGEHLENIEHFVEIIVVTHHFRTSSSEGRGRLEELSV
jgi:hypothetical protein